MVFILSLQLLNILEWSMILHATKTVADMILDIMV